MIGSKSRIMAWPADARANMLVLGGALIALPLATGMFARASAGQAMMRDFEPIMAADSVKATTGYYGLFKGIGTDFGPVMAKSNVDRFQGYLEGLNGMSSDMRAFMAAFGRQMHMTPVQVQAFMNENYPSMAAMLRVMPQMQTDMGGMVATMSKDGPGFAQVAPALTHFQRLISVMQSNVDRFAKANRLQPMGLLPWYFVAIGGVLVLLGLGLVVGETRAARIEHVEEIGSSEHVKAA